VRPMLDDSIIGVTMGDPAGIGPEIIAKLFASFDVYRQTRPIVIGDVAIMKREIAALDLNLKLRMISDPADAIFKKGMINLLPTSSLSASLPRGVVMAEAGRAAFGYIVKAVDLVKHGRLSGICTAPIHKEALKAAGIPYPGHTEILADLTQSPNCAMMLLTPELRTILVTVHVALSEAIRNITIESELRTIQIANSTLKRIGIARPRIAVAGLNPHAGEGGLFGREEIEVIAPAISQAQNQGIDASGPHPGDTVFMNARRGRFDIVVAQFHDQGLIPIKLLGFEHGVNMTAGLPIVRTSVDHGTAFDIAGQGKADASSLWAALLLAGQLIQQQNRNAA
jgi:4-hydroxythreonine-4-phosphate dehydrogenase